ncbi:NADP-dependent methylenetetrahydromethanopterin/methylenetetrahydrofolate dehydrogenase [Rubinisphaera sp.]|uniref:NADP-dependent methylenetetrahydromethanopterin/methylenetetrahydrofolate dehydrogenase n=1 Tax=Rubinisphaera sp. TaxID=2024857 RepID=UPI000C0CE8C1|nr:NADP-dependent methylenetetrahydromethanopterin/methylenetetrahydrofolate dehydrogenase [Rubinisphaera sp.]MBV09721.1 bifunctional NADP-dependent methylenetetrahydromethanopterin dehydrogenase/methylenetetrahydrofolate dehydrogenase [Rubinisphaera sp.]|tara:strand:+ start:24866 stop:25720 length:855 start_codon:yes stop_codon:yes gene_type:complete
MKRILLQLDSDSHPSSFDAVTAIDGGVDQLLSYGNVSAVNVVSLVQGAMFTRSPKNLHNTAIFLGGSNVEAGESLMKRIQEQFFGPIRVSVMMDSNGCNTTASAAVIYAQSHLKLQETKSVVLGGTGPVGRRVAKLLALQGSHVRVVSRQIERARQVCLAIDSDSGLLEPAAFTEDQQIQDLTSDADLIVAAGAAGVEFCKLDELRKLEKLRVVIDLNAVPPLGIDGIESSDKARKVDHLLCYGAVGVGGLKMKLHHQMISKLFESNDQIFDTKSIFEAGQKLL